MRKIEKEEEQISYDDPDKKVFHLCIVNLVIGWVAHSDPDYTGSQQVFTVKGVTMQSEISQSILFCIISDVKVREEEEKSPAFISKIISVKPFLHTCVLSFRTLYCAKGNYDFGISRVIKSLEPYNKKVRHFSTNCISQIQKITETFGSPRLTTTSSPTAQFNAPDVWLAPSAHS